MPPLSPGKSDEFDIWFEDERGTGIDYDEDECEHEEMTDPYDEI